jgi:hypothetical protein
MKKGIDVAAILVIIGVALYLFLSSEKPAMPPGALSTQAPDASQVGSSSTAPGDSSAIAGSNSPEMTSSQTQAQPASLADRAGRLVPESSPSVQLPPETVLQNVQRAVRKYGEMFGGNPVGTNPEITGQLSGNNPRHMNFITSEAGMRVDADGNLVDAWGTPYFFHQISGSEMEIHSAGPDKVMWTPDDLVVK